MEWSIGRGKVATTVGFSIEKATDIVPLAQRSTASTRILKTLRVNFRSEKFALADGMTLVPSLIENAVSRRQRKPLNYFTILYSPCVKHCAINCSISRRTGSKNTYENKHLPAKRLDFPGMSGYFTRRRTRAARVLGSEFVGEIHETDGSPRCKSYNGSS